MEAGADRNMDFGGKYLFAAPRHAVWAALNDTSVLQKAIPGCTRIDWVSGTALEAAIAVNLGVARPVFNGDLHLSDVEPASSYTLTGRGRGGLLGHAHATAGITLTDHAEGTVLAFTAQGGASPRIMKLGRSLVGASAQKLIDGFFARIAGAMGVEVTPLDS